MSDVAKSTAYSYANFVSNIAKPLYKAAVLTTSSVGLGFCLDRIWRDPPISEVGSIPLSSCGLSVTVGSLGSVLTGSLWPLALSSTSCIPVVQAQPSQCETSSPFQIKLSEFTLPAQTFLQTFLSTGVYYENFSLRFLNAYSIECDKVVVHPEIGIDRFQKHIENSLREAKNTQAKMRGSIVFGKAEWATHFGDIGNPPLLPEGIDKILRADCPIWPGKPVEETHLLTLIPERVNGRPLTLDYLEELCMQKQGVRNIGKYAFYHPMVKNHCGQVATEKSYWVLMTKKELPKTRGLAAPFWIITNEGMRMRPGTEDVWDKPYLEEILKYQGYQFPKPIEVVVGLLQEYARRGVPLYNDPDWEGPRVISKDSCLPYPIFVGDFDESTGLEIGLYNRVFRNDVCAIGLRRL